jgi:hypothetical protein
MMALRSIVLLPRRTASSAKDIHLDIVHTLGSDAVGYSTMMLYLPNARWVDPMDLETAPDDDYEPDDSYRAIFAALSEMPFA